jgi:hypothetical protein
LLGLFAFGILTKKVIKNALVWPICIAGPLLTLIIDLVCNPAYYETLLHTKLGLNDISTSIFHGYKIGPELILINGAITFLGLLIVSKNSSVKQAL